MEKDLDNIKQKINSLVIKYGIRYIVLKTTDTAFAEGEIIGCNVEAELIY